MANDWIKMRTNLDEDPAVYGIAGATKLTRPAVVGSLHILWSWADEHTADGFMVGITGADIDDKVGRRGFALAMAKFGWLSIESEGVCFPNFLRHNGESAKKRALAGERQRDKRDRDSEQSTSSNGIPLSQEKRDKPVTEQRQSCDKSVTREEKSIQQQQQRRLISVSDFSELASRFPGVDIPAEHAKARAYVRQQRGPTAEVEHGFFCENWLPKSPVTRSGQLASSAAEEPDGWRNVIADTNYGPGGSFPASAWSELPSHVQAHVRETLNSVDSPSGDNCP